MFKVLTKNSTGVIKTDFYKFDLIWLFLKKLKGNTNPEENY